MERADFSDLIIEKFRHEGISDLKREYAESGKINHLIIDNLFPNEIAEKLDKFFPYEDDLTHLDMVQENKYVGVNFYGKQKIVEECLYSFQDENVIKLIAQITDVKGLEGDPELYAGGISSMSKGCFLNPHIDNSHNREMTKFRRFNLLYYVNKKFLDLDGGELILYPDGIKNSPIEIPCVFNRLVIMRTDNKSLHGVNKVTATENRRKCISNYYFSESSPLGKEYYHSTSFRGFGNEFIKDLYLQSNGILRSFVKKVIKTVSGESISTGYHKGGKKEN